MRSLKASAHSIEIQAMSCLEEGLTPIIFEINRNLIISSDQCSLEVPMTMVYRQLLDSNKPLIIFQLLDVLVTLNHLFHIPSLTDQGFLV